MQSFSSGPSIKPIVSQEQKKDPLVSVQVSPQTPLSGLHSLISNEKWKNAF